MSVVELAGYADEVRTLRQDVIALRQALRFAIDERDFWRGECDREKERAALLVRRLTDTIRELGI